MNLIALILGALKESILSFSPNRSQYEALMKFDFEIDNARQNLMQLCFSPFSNWTLLLLVGLISIDPTKYSWSLLNIFGPISTTSFYLLDGQLGSMAAIALLFFLLEWILRKEVILIALLFYFLGKSDIHLHLAVAGVMAVYFSRSCYLWWFHIELEGQARKVWKMVTFLQILTTFAVAGFGLWALDYAQFNQYFSGSLQENRFQFLFYLVAFFQLAYLLTLSFWGHFYFQRLGPNQVKGVHYSTATWILRFKMSFLMKKKLKQKTEGELASRRAALKKDQSPGLSAVSSPGQLDKELGYLQLAASRLTVD